MTDRIEATRKKAASIINEMSNQDRDDLIHAHRVAIQAAELYAQLVASAVRRVNAKRKESARVAK